MFVNLVPVSLLASFTLFSLFVFYHQRLLHRFEGSSEACRLVLGCSAFTGTIIGYGFLIYCGFAVIWYMPFLLAGISLCLCIAWFAVEAVIDRVLAELTGERGIPFRLLSVLGFVGWPLSAILMVMSLP